jgi:hypothetical protein
LLFSALLIVGITAFLFFQGGTSDPPPNTLREFATLLKQRGIRLKELRSGLYLYLSENPAMTLERCTSLPFFAERLGDWRGVVVVSPREMNNLALVPDSVSHDPKCPYAFSVGSLDVFGDPVLVRRIRASFGESKSRSPLQD